VRYLVVGLGNIGRKRQGILGPRCVATVDPYNPEADYSAAAACADERYDAAVVSVPTRAKLDLLDYFLRRGKHVLVEKPLLFPDRGAAERLESVARATGAIWYTSYNHRFEPLIVALKQQLDEETIGPLYHGRFAYGNGTVASVSGSWRDSGLGVLEDLGPHLLDLTRYLLGEEASFTAWSLERHEATGGFDHCVLASADHRLVLEMSFLSWKNSFGIELVGSRGSLHLCGLPKWGTSELVVHHRVFPSGVPRETRQTVSGPDVTWERDLEHFETLPGAGRTSLDNDWWISRTVREIACA